MGLFGKKKKEETKASACCCGGGEPTVETSAGCCCGTASKAEASASCCGKPVEGICCIKVLGAGCKSCHQQYEYAKEAVKDMGLSVEVEYVTDLAKVMEYGVMSMPAIVVNEKVVSMGKVLKVSDVRALLQAYGK